MAKDKPEGADKAAETTAPDAAAIREAKIKSKMQVAGMTRESAEHVVDQQAKEDAARAAKK